MGEYTKGKWRVVGPTPTPMSVNRGLWEVCGQANVANDCTYADAHLLAAAPDLLKALEDVPLPSSMGGWAEFIPRFYNWYEGQRKAALSLSPPPATRGEK